MAFIALKPCRFAGRSFRIGETIPDEMIHPGAAKNLVKMGVISSAEEGITQGIPFENIPITVQTEEGETVLDVTHEGLQSVFNVLLSTAADAAPIIEQMTDRDALLLLSLSDGRKVVKNAVEAQTKARDTEEAGEQ